MAVSQYTFIVVGPIIPIRHLLAPPTSNVRVMDTHGIAVQRHDQDNHYGLFHTSIRFDDLFRFRFVEEDSARVAEVMVDENLSTSEIRGRLCNRLYDVVTDQNVQIRTIP